MPFDARKHRAHAAQSQRADGVGETEIRVEVVGNVEDLLCAEPVESLMQDRRETTRVGASAGALKYSFTCARSAASTERNRGD